VVVRPPKRHPEFVTPEGLRPRVDFWKGIFSRYERNQVSIHHRAYPHITFEVLDLRQEAAVMTPVLFEKYRDKAIEKRIKEYYDAFEHLAAGGLPQSGLQQLIADKLPKIDGIPNVYAWTIKERFVRTQSGIKDRWEQAIQRSGRYLPLMERVFVEEYGLPVELTRLPFVESSFDYQAYSSVGAAGIWQFMPRTGKEYRLIVSSTVDERRDPLKATDAAARYLSSAYASIRNWPLATTSYNHGVGGVLKRIREAGTTDIVTLLEHPTNRPFGFASSNFFPSLLAAIETFDERRERFPDISPLPALRLTEYRLPRAMSVGHVSRQLGLPVERLREANYALLEPVWQGRSAIPAGYVLRVPEEYAPRLASLRAPESGGVAVTAPAASSVYGGLVYKVRKGDTLSAIAKRHGVLVSQIKNLNNLKTDQVRIGQLLRIKEQERARHSSQEPPQESAQQGSSGSESQGLVHVVRPGETLYEIGRRYGVSVDAIMRTNRLAKARIQVGQKLKIEATPMAGLTSSPKAATPSAARTYIGLREDTLGKIAADLTVFQSLRSSD
jgi:membrane-bound lytic murein transglycosylase D